MKKCGLLFFLVCLCLSFHGHAQKAAILNDSITERIYTLNEVEYLIDSTNNLTIDQIINPATSILFREHDSYLNKDFRNDFSYWIRFPVTHSSKTKKVWLMEFYDQTIDHLEVYTPQPGDGYEKKVMGDTYPFKQRTLLHKNFEVMLDVKTDTVMVYYFRIQSHEFADIRIAFRSVDRFTYYALNEYFLFGIFYGMILIIVLYNFLVYLAIREAKYINYIFYILSVAFYAMSLDGIGFQYLWSSYPKWNELSTGFFLYMLIFWALVFTRRFLSTKANAPFLHKVLFWTIMARTALFVDTLFFHRTLFVLPYIEIIPLSLIFYTGIKVWYEGYRPARFFVVAYGVLFIGFFIRALVFFNIIPFTIISHNSLNLSFVVEMLFLTFALGDRIRILKDNRDRALRKIITQHEANMQLKDKVNRELEQKVQERIVELNSKNTELENTNSKLERQAFEINQINSILDLDNWKLKNSIKEVLNERLMEKTMDYHQFKTLYPEKLSCYRRLEEMKWEKGFICNKCGNDKYFNGAAKFAHRCTRCGYNESITAFTIFHSIKFPIEKAFYIAYLVVAGKKDSTLAELAEQLDLRVNTIWSFKHKTQERIAQLEKKGRKPTISRWEDVILSGDHSTKSVKTSPKNGLKAKASL
jgi:hypothetical protein